MPQATNYMTSNDLIAAIKRKVLFPISQSTFSEIDLLSFLNDEMIISQVPSILEFHQEFYVYQHSIPLLPNVNRYAIPDRAIGMKLRSLFWSDANGNFFEMTRISAQDKAFFQRNIGANQAIHKYYIEGNDIVLAPAVIGNPTGNLNFFVFLKPNQLVLNSRAATIQSFTATLTIDNSHINAGDVLTIGNFDASLQTNPITQGLRTEFTPGTNTENFQNTCFTVEGFGTYYTFTATTGAPLANQFLIGANSTATANNLVALLNSSAANVVASTTLTSPNVITISYPQLTSTFITNNATNQPTLGMIIANTQGIIFDAVANTWLNPVTGTSEPLFVNGALVDFLQTKAGHRIWGYDIAIPSAGISSNTINFAFGTVPPQLVIGDYICLANECIIPYLPSDLHTGLAERGSARILAALGDQAGLAIANAKIAEIDKRQGNLIDNRVDGNPLKVTGRKSLLRFGKSSTIKRF